MKKIIVVSLLIIITINCNKKQTQNIQSTADSTNHSDTTVVVDMHNSQNSIDIDGTYKGIISCDDCENVVLTLKPNQKYSLIIYLSGEEKNSNSVVKAQGTYSWDTSGSIITLDKYDLRFKVGEGKLFYLDHSLAIEDNEILIKQ